MQLLLPVPRRNFFLRAGAKDFAIARPLEDETHVVATTGEWQVSIELVIISIRAAGT